MPNFCSKCGNPLGEGTKFCTKCGTEVAKATTKSAVKQGTQAVASIFSLAASPVAGETAVGGFSPVSSVTNIRNPLGTILSGVKRIFTGFTNASKNKNGLVAAIILAIVWILLTLLPMLNINPLPVKLASWLTFAQGGLKGGVLGFIGGIIGKGMLTTLILSLFSGGFNGTNSVLKRLFFGFQSGFVGTTLVGIGLALIMFNMMAGISSPMQSMAGITGFLLSIKALGGGGFIRKLAISVTANKNGKIRTENTAKCTALLSGLSLGFAVVAAISFIPWGYTPYCLGGVAVVVGVILSIVCGNKKEVSV